MRLIVQALVETLDDGTPLPVTTGDNLRHNLEIALALRESARRGGAGEPAPGGPQPRVLPGEEPLAL